MVVPTLILGIVSKCQEARFSVVIEGELDKLLKQYLMKINPKFTGMLSGQTVCWTLKPGHVGVLDPEILSKLKGTNEPRIVNELPEMLKNQTFEDFRHMSMIRLSAERDIKPEKLGDYRGRATGAPMDRSSVRTFNVDEFSPTGEGATRIMKRMLTSTIQSHRSLIEVVLLNALNKIYYPDTKFTRIFPIEREPEAEQFWEIFLQDETQTSVPLSKMGSGVRLSSLPC